VPPLDISAAIDHMLATTGDSVVVGTRRGGGTLERRPIEEMYEGAIRIVGHELTLTVRDGAFPTLAIDGRLTVAGQWYTVRDIGPVLPDGTRDVALAEG